MNKIAKIAAFTSCNKEASPELKREAYELLTLSLSQKHINVLLDLDNKDMFTVADTDLETLSILRNLVELGLACEEQVPKITVLLPAEFLNLPYEILVFFDIFEKKEVIDSIFLLREVAKKYEIYYLPNGQSIVGPVRESVQLYGKAGINNMLSEEQIKNLRISPEYEVNLKDLGIIIGLTQE